MRSFTRHTDYSVEVMVTEQRALSYLDSAKYHATAAAKILTARGETDEAAMKTVAVLDAIDAARTEIEVRAKANGAQG